MNIRIGNDAPQVQQGKQIVQTFLEGKGATDFEWNRDFDNRNWSVKFNCDGGRYRSSIGHVSLTDLKDDPEKQAKFKALWECRTKM